MSIVSVRLNHGLSYHNRIFIQPLFYISEQIRQYLYKVSNNDSYNESKVDNNIKITFETNDKIQLEMMPTNNWSDIDLYYFINRYNTKLEFEYKGKNMFIKTLACDTDNTIIVENREEYTIFSAYEINYYSKDIANFEEFIKASIKFYQKFTIDNNDKADTINLYITSQEGFYFQPIGKRNKRPMSSIHLPKKQKQDIINDLDKFLKPETKKRYNQLGINYKRTYLLEGVPGAGKTSLITGLASLYNANIAIVSFIPKMTDVDLIRSLRSLREYDDTSKDETSNKRTFLVFEDIDCIFKERKSNDENRNNITFSGLLNALDGITTNDIICFITTNYKHNLDSALLRPGRIDYIMRFDYAVKEQIQSIYKDFTSTANDTQITEFYDACCSINIKITTSLLQQYLMKYIDMPQEAIDNIDEMKTMYEVANVSKEADETGLYS